MLIKDIRERKLRKLGKPVNNKLQTSTDRLAVISEIGKNDPDDFVNFDAEELTDQDDSEEEIEFVKREYGIKRIYIEQFFSSPIAIRVSLMKQG